MLHFVAGTTTAVTSENNSVRPRATQLYTDPNLGIPTTHRDLSASLNGDTSLPTRRFTLPPYLTNRTMTPFAYRHSEASDDDLAHQIRKATTNKQKVILVERHLSCGGLLTLTEPSDIAAQNRMLALTKDRAQELQCTTNGI